MATARAASSLHSAEGRKADVLVQDFDLGEADLAQQVQLEQLLERFVSGRETAAPEALVRRHGPMVWGVCRRILSSHHPRPKRAYSHGETVRLVERQRFVSGPVAPCRTVVWLVRQ